MPASRESVDQLFALFAVSYGKRWMDMWDGLDMDMVASLWADELGGLKVRHIKYGIEHRPKVHPPTAMEFRDICKMAPEPSMQCLPEPYTAPDPARVAEVLAPLRKINFATGSLDWAWRLRDRAVNHGGKLPSGRMMTEYQSDAWQKALEHGKYAPLAQPVVMDKPTSDAL